LATLAEPAEADRARTLDELERRTRERWGIAALLVVAVVAAMVLLVLEGGTTRYAPVAGGAFLVVAVVFAGSVWSQERREREIVRVLMAERERASALGARARALEAMHHAVAGVAAAETLDELYDRALRTAQDMSDADRAVVWLRVGATVTVAASHGRDAPAPGTVASVETGTVGAVVRTGQALVTGPGSEWGTGPAGDAPTVAAPLRLPDRVAGVLLLQRDDPERPFAEIDRTATTLFAEQTALAMRAATRLDVERERGSERDRALEQQGDLTATLVHDLKAPVAAVVGYLQLLRDREERFDADRRRRIYDDVLGEAERVGDLLEDLLAVASAEHGATLGLETIDVGELLAEVARTAEGLAHRQAREREIEVLADPRLRMVADRRALLRVLINLVDNAISYSPPGSPLSLGARREGEWVVLRVEDRGPGMADGVRAQAFERFVSTGDGSGLGLYVVRALVEAHGGRVRLHDRAGGGTRVEVSLPAGPPADGEDGAGTVRAARAGAGHRRR
jgi:two-component system, OmpR family, sensor histidine kinase KdpD